MNEHTKDTIASEISKNDSQDPGAATPRRTAKRFWKDTRGATFAEYLVLVGAIAAIGGALYHSFGDGAMKAGTAAATKIGQVK